MAFWPCFLWFCLGGAIILYFVVKKNINFIGWFTSTLFHLFINLVLLDIAGLLVYMPYRTPGGPRTFLKASESTAWLHSVVFEHIARILIR